MRCRHRRFTSCWRQSGSNCRWLSPPSPSASALPGASARTRAAAAPRTFAGHAGQLEQWYQSGRWRGTTDAKNNFDNNEQLLAQDNTVTPTQLSVQINRTRIQKRLMIHDATADFWPVLLRVRRSGYAGRKRRSSRRYLRRTLVPVGKPNSGFLSIFHGDSRHVDDRKLEHSL